MQKKKRIGILDMFKEKRKVKLPDFEIKESKLVILPEESKKLNVSYQLIPPFASARIRWDEKEKQILYFLEEPKLSEKEKEFYAEIVKGLVQIIDVELSAIKRPEEAIDYLEKQVGKVMEELELDISKESFLKIMYYIYRDFVGLNEIEPLIKDPWIEDISCNGVGIPIYVMHRKYGSMKTNIIFEESKKLEDLVIKLAERSGRYISYAEPLLDGSLPDGSRVQASIAKDVTTKGPTFTIRKFVPEPYTPLDMIRFNTASSEMMAYLWIAIENGLSILVSGGTGTGKTSFLNAISMFIPPAAKIISVEDTRELQLPHENWIPSVARPAFAGSYGEVTMFDLLKESFRQAPNYVIVGEVRGQEAYVLFQGMGAGMPGMGTMHAGKFEDMMHRLTSPPISLSPALLELLDIAIIMVHAREKGENARRVKEIVEIESVDPNTMNARTNKVFGWQPSDDSFEFRGSSWALQKISTNKGISIDDLKKEIQIRKKILDWMVKQKLKGYKEVSKIFSDYYENQKEFLKKNKI